MLSKTSQSTLSEMFVSSTLTTTPLSTLEPKVVVGMMEEEIRTMEEEEEVVVSLRWLGIRGFPTSRLLLSKRLMRV